GVPRAVSLIDCRHPIRPATGADEPTEPPQSPSVARSRRLSNPLGTRDDRRVEPTGALLGELVAFGGPSGKLVAESRNGVAKRVRAAGEIPIGLFYLLNDEFNFVTAPRMCLRTGFIGVIVVVVAQVPNPVSIRLERFLELLEQRCRRVEPLMISIPQRRQGRLLFIEKLVRDHAHDKAPGSQDPVPIADCAAVIGSMFEHVA